MFILASKSISRASLLNQSGISYETYGSDLDETTIKKACWDQGASVEQTSLELAIEKARRVGKHFPQAYVLGSDQMVACEGRWFDKAESLDEAREQLMFLRGKSHTLPTSAAIIHQNELIWHHTATPILTMRFFSDHFVDAYLTKMDKTVLTAVGCYQIEKLGAQLFEEIQGDIFTIMGLPLLPLLDYLRQIGLAQT